MSKDFRPCQRMLAHSHHRRSSSPWQGCREEVQRDRAVSAQLPTAERGDVVMSASPGQQPTESAEPAELRGQGANLALATWVFAINFWAWNLIGPLSATYTKAMSLTSTQTALLVATPILVGSVGRIPVGALTDRYGGRKMFTVISLITIVPVLLITFAGNIDSYALLLVFGFFLGIGGTTFAVAAVIARPIGGILSDRLHPKIVVMISLTGAAVMAVVVSLQPAPELAAGASFIVLAFF